jgi:hypothetical protein
LILGNDSNGPSITPFANNLGQGGASTGSPPSNSGSLLDSWNATGLGGDTLAMLLPQLDDASTTPLPAGAVYFGQSALQSPPSLASTPAAKAPLSSLFETGLGGDVIASMLPQRQDSSAALLSPSALAPSQPLQDPTPFELPEMTMDQAALAYGMSPEQVAEIHQSVQRQAAANIVTDTLVGAAAGAGLEAVGVPALAVNLAHVGMGIHDALDIAQQLRDAPDQAIFKRLNDSEIQSIPSTGKAWLP